MKTIVLVDIDGNINALASKINPPRISTHWNGLWGFFPVLKTEHPNMFLEQPEAATHYDINFSRELLTRLADISTADDVQFHWLTTWEHHAHSVFCLKADFLTGLNWPVIARVEDSIKWWKITQVERILQENPDSHIIWLDDEAAEDFCHDIIADLVEQSNRLTVIVPNPNRGLTVADVGFIENMIRNPQPGMLIA